VVREPPRGRFDTAAASTRPARFGEVMRTLLGKRSFWGLSFGASASSMMGYGMFFWLPSFFVRSHGLTLLEASLFFGAILLVGGMAGIWLGGTLADRFGAKGRRYYALIPAVAFVATIPFYVGAVTTGSLAVAFVLFLVPTALGLVWLGPVLSAIQHVVPPHMRATASAIFLFINNLIGIGIGTAALGALSDALVVRHGADSLRYAILYGTSFYVIAATLFLLSARRLERDWEK
jgi:sugar phosphate permease